MGQLNSRKTVIVQNSRFYHNYSVFEFFRAIFWGMSSLWNGGVPETIVVHSPTLNEDKISLLCHSLQICLKLRSFPHSLSGAQKVQICTVHGWKTLHREYNQIKKNTLFMEDTVYFYIKKLVNKVFFSSIVQFMFLARQYQSNMTKRPWWL